MSSSPLISLLLTLTLLLSTQSSSQLVPATPFKCNVTTPRCKSLVYYQTPNTTTFSHIKHLFGVKNFRSLLGANNLPPSTPPNATIKAGGSIKIPFPCLCRDGSGVSAKRPVYSVVKDDGLYHIAMEVFSGLSSVDMIARYNGIKNKNVIEIGQKLWVPLPCSCDSSVGTDERVVHCGYVVPVGGSLKAIAKEFDVTEGSLLKVNGIANATQQLIAGQLLDVPLRACTSMINSTSLDYPLLVANGTYTFTANNCVMCKCDAANNWTLECQPSGLRSSKWPSCPSMKCSGDGGLTIGNSTDSSGCGKTTCAYAGYTNETILTAVGSTCPAPGNDASMIHVKSWSLIFGVVLVHFVMLLSSAF